MSISACLFFTFQIIFTFQSSTPASAGCDHSGFREIIDCCCASGYFDNLILPYFPFIFKTVRQSSIFILKSTHFNLYVCVFYCRLCYFQSLYIDIPYNILLVFVNFPQNGSLRVSTICLQYIFPIGTLLTHRQAKILIRLRLKILYNLLRLRLIYSRN